VERAVHIETMARKSWWYNQPMGRPTVRSQRRTHIARAFARVLARHGQGAPTIAAIAEEAGVAPGLVHHHFESKQELFTVLVDELLREFRRRVDAADPADPLEAYVQAALALGHRSDVVAARAWVGVFAEAMADPVLFAKVRRLLDAEVAHVERRGRGSLSTAGAGAVVAFVVGALVFGAFAPQKTAGFAAPSLSGMLTTLRRQGRGRAPK
jgi:TetR/AcrR family transcriptional repressor of bet genes